MLGETLFVHLKAVRKAARLMFGWAYYFSIPHLDRAFNHSSLIVLQFLGLRNTDTVGEYYDKRKTTEA